MFSFKDFIKFHGKRLNTLKNWLSKDTTIRKREEIANLIRSLTLAYHKDKAFDLFPKLDIVFEKPSLKNVLTFESGDNNAPPYKIKKTSAMDKTNAIVQSRKLEDVYSSCIKNKIANLFASLSKKKYL